MENIQFLNKASLYSVISKKIINLGFDIFSESYRVNSINLAYKSCKNLKLEILEFKEPKICGILYKGKGYTTMALNARRSEIGRNFDCMHELIHYWFHNTDFFYCVSGAYNHMEWQANEGAAQFLMPYQNFIPAYCNMYDIICKNNKEEEFQNLIKILSKKYIVGETAIIYRINSLKFEIKEYINGANIKNIRIFPSKFKYIKKILEETK